MKLVKFAAMAAAAMCLTGCYNLRTNPYEPLDNCTVGESFQHYIFGAHDCRRTSKDCIPICAKDLKKYQENKLLSEKNWKRFTRFNPERYRYQRTGLILFDDINPIVLNLSFQIKHEIVIPYIALDKEGLISTYDMFITDVQTTQKIYKETHKKDLSFGEACKQTYAMWQKRYGEEPCKKLMNAISLIETLSANKQFVTAVARNYAAVTKLILRAERGAAQLKRAAKDWRGIVKITEASLITAGNLNELLWAVTYLNVYLTDKEKMASHVKDYLNQF